MPERRWSSIGVEQVMFNELKTLKAQAEGRAGRGLTWADFFAILIPYDKDDELKEYADHDFLVELASEDTVAEHPPILAMQPMDSADGEFPRLDENEEEEWHSLCLSFPAKAGETALTLPIKVVFEGIGDIE